MKALALTVVAVVLGACGGGTSVAIVGKMPADQAADIADALCEKQVDCGSVEVSCHYDSTTMVYDCTGTIKHDETYDVCYADTEADIRADLERCNLTADQERQLQSCINARLDQSCVTQAELDAYIAKYEAGDTEAKLRPEIPECQGLEAIFESCPNPYAQNTTNLRVLAGERLNR